MNNDVAGEIVFAAGLHLVIALIFLFGACIVFSEPEPKPVPASSCSCECRVEEL